MKQSFSKIELLGTRLICVTMFVVNILLWCLTTLSVAQRNTRPSILPKPSAAFAVPKSSTILTITRLTPKLAQTMTSTTPKSVSPQENTLSSATASRTSLYSSVGVTATTLTLPTIGERPGETSSNLYLIVGVTASIALFVLITGIFVVRFFKKRKQRRNERNARITFSGGSLDNCHEDIVCDERDLGFHVLNKSNSGYASDSLHDNGAEAVMQSPHRTLRSVARSTGHSERSSRGLMPITDDIGYCRSLRTHILRSDIADGKTKKPAIENLVKNPPTRPGLAKKTIPTEGGVIQIDDIILNIGPECLAEETEITLIKDDQNFAFQSLLDLSLVNSAPRIVEFLPDGLKFLEPADLRIKFDRTDPSSELFILHGTYNPDYQMTVWELVTNDILENRTAGVVHMKIHGFCFYSYLLSSRSKIARVLSHLNSSFTCRAYALYRRLHEMPTIDIAVVFFTEFVMEEHDNEEDVKQLKDLYEEGYVKGEKGKLRLVHTNRRLEMCLDIPGVESSPFPFKMEVRELDKHGYVVDHFKNIAKPSPVSGTVTIKEVHQSQNIENKLLWTLNVREMETEIPTEAPLPIPTPPGSEKQEYKVVLRTTRLTNSEISRMSRIIGVDWDSLAGLMDIPYETREEIRFNVTKYPDFSSKAGKIFALFNGSQQFGRHILEKCVEELKRPELKQEMLSVENDDEMVDQPCEGMEMPVARESDAQAHMYENDEVQLRHTRLTPREMFKLSCRIPLDWDSLAGLMDVAKETREDIRANTMYNDNRARAEKILSIINRQENFSRKKLAECFEDIKQLDLIVPITTGAWRSL